MRAARRWPKPLAWLEGAAPQLEKLTLHGNLDGNQRDLVAVCKERGIDFETLPRYAIGKWMTRSQSRTCVAASKEQPIPCVDSREGGEARPPPPLLFSHFKLKVPTNEVHHGGSRPERRRRSWTAAARHALLQSGGLHGACCGRWRQCSGGGGRTHGFLLRIYPVVPIVSGVYSALAAGEQPTHPHSRGGGAKK